MKKGAGDIVRGQTCNYLVKFPSNAKTGDIVYFRANVVTRCTVYYTVASGFNNGIIKSGVATKGTRFEIVYPQQVYLTVLGTNSLSLDYNIWAWGALAPPSNSTNNNTNGNNTNGNGTAGNNTNNGTTGNNTNGNGTTGNNTNNGTTGNNTGGNNTNGTTGNNTGGNNTNGNNTGGNSTGGNNTGGNNTSGNNTGGNNTGGNSTNGNSTGDGGTGVIGVDESSSDDKSMLIAICLSVVGGLLLIVGAIFMVLCFIKKRKAFNSLQGT